MSSVLSLCFKLSSRSFPKSGHFMLGSEEAVFRFRSIINKNFIPNTNRTESKDTKDTL